MYDDDAGDANRKRARVDQNGDLFGDRLGHSNGRLRNRSASPAQGRGREDRERSRSPHRNSKKELFPSAINARKELFPSAINAGKELFPSSGTAEPSTKELFPSKQSTGAMRMDMIPSKRGSISNHRRSDAFDASTINDFFSSTPPPRERSLADRITRPESASDDIRIKGAANSGFSIRGAAAGSGTRELFPLKAGSNLGKELFGEKLKGRGGPRRKAEDMFGT
jgi:hypothetical protein